MEPPKNRVVIKEVYRHFQPGRRFDETVSALLDSIPPEYLAGLKTVVLTDAAGLGHAGNRGRTWSRGKKVRIRNCRGLYHQAFRGEPAWIELFTDNILYPYPKPFLRFQFFREVVFSEVLFHELGHHIHRTRAPEFREREDVADVWKKRLTKAYIWRLHPFFAVMMSPFGFVFRLIKRCRKRFRSLH